MRAVTSFTGEYRWLSNFWASPVELDGETYPTVEHAYQAAKTLDAFARERIRRCLTPGSAKRMGRRLSLRADWEEIKLDVMLGLLYQKFGTEDLRNLLTQTDTAELIEGNTWGDKFWGVDIRSGQGANNLGRLLMQIRDELRPEGGQEG